MKKFIFILVLLILGLALRIYFLTHSYDHIVFDAKTYIENAHQMLQGKFPIEKRDKNLGYSFYLAIIFWFRSDVDIVRWVQVFVDIATGIILWRAALKIFPKAISYVVFGLYMLNPFTASYVAILLPEVVSCFVVSILIYLVSTTRFSSRPLLWFFVGLDIGLLLFLKPAFLYISFALIILTGLSCIEKKNWYRFYLLCIFGFFIASSYTLGTYVIKLKVIALAPPYSTMWAQTYVMSFYANRYPEVVFWGVVPELSTLNWEFSQTPDANIGSWNAKYRSLFFQRVMNEPQRFIYHYARNMLWLWDKDHLSVYEDKLYPIDKYPLRILNIMLLLCSVFGIVQFVRRTPRFYAAPIIVCTCVMLGVSTVLFPLVSNESRHTIALYPFVFLWASFGVYTNIRLLIPKYRFHEPR